MRTFIADIIPKIQRYSQKLDDLTRLTNQHWVSLGDINQTKRVFIFRANNQLLISDNGIVEKGSWEYLGNQSLLLETKAESYLLKHGFFDENVIALKLDSTDSYAFFINETKFHGELNKIEDILKFLEKKYLANEPLCHDLGSARKYGVEREYKIVSEKEKFEFDWGLYSEYSIEFPDGLKGRVYRGASTGKFFFDDFRNGKQYNNNFEDTVRELHFYLQRLKNL
jgi:hypothetical protein